MDESKLSPQEIERKNLKLVHRGEEQKQYPSEGANENIEQRNPEIIQMIKEGRPAMVLLDDGKTIGCFTQGLSQPAMIGILNVFLIKFTFADLIKDMVAQKE